MWKQSSIKETRVPGFDPSSNPNASDQIYRTSKVNSDVNANTSTSGGIKDVLGSCRRAISFYQQLQVMLIEERLIA